MYGIRTHYQPLLDQYHRSTYMGIHFNLGSFRLVSTHCLYVCGLSYFNLLLRTGITTFIAVGYANFNIGSVLTY